MVFSIKNLSKPTKEDYEAVKRLQCINPDFLDSKELWILENFVEGDDDE